MNKSLCFLLFMIISYFGAKSQEYIKENIFSFEISKNWKRLEQDHLVAYKQQLINIVKEINDTHFTIPYISVFQTVDQKAELSITSLKIPPQNEYYFEQMYASRDNKIKRAIQQGDIKKLLTNRIIEINGMPAIEGEYEMTNGSIKVTYTFYFSKIPYLLINIDMKFESLVYYEKYKTDCQNILKSLKIEFDQTFQLKNQKCRLSEEAQKYLIITGENEYESTTKVLVIQEPHYDYEGQWNLYKGLEIFFKENPNLVTQTVFLSEGLESEKLLDISPLIKINPKPTKEIIQLVLYSYLIPAYVGYKWSNKHTIPIIGTEDLKLYDASVKLWIYYHEDDIWPLSVVARNKRMSEVLIKSYNKYNNPILFIGGKHLSSIENKAYEKSLTTTTDLISTDIINDLKKTQNLGIKDFLEKAHIGYVYLEPVSSNQYGDRKRYRELFIAQIHDDYLEYIKEFLSSSKTSFSPESINKNVTVTPSPKAAAQLLLTYNSSSNNNQENKGEKENNDEQKDEADKSNTGEKTEKLNGSNVTGKSGDSEKGFNIKGQLADIFSNLKSFLNWLKGNQSLSRVNNPLSAKEAQQLIDNAKQLGAKMEANTKGLQGLEKTGKWGGIPHFKIGNIHIPIQKGLDKTLKF